MAVENTLDYYDTAIISAVKCFKVKPQVHLVILGATTLSLMALTVTVLGIKDSPSNSSVATLGRTYFAVLPSAIILTVVSPLLRS
jgi:hypothetical protein